MKLLIATEFPPNASGGGPAVVRQMLWGWPVENLCWWSCLPERDRRFGQKVARHFCAAIPRKLMPHLRLTRAKSILLNLGWAPLAAAHLKKTIRELQPDAIWAIPHNWSIPPLRSVLPTAGVGFHVTIQDYVDVHGQSRRFGEARTRQIADAADFLYATATTRDATSPPLMDDLKNRTGASASQMLHAGLEENDFRYLQAKTESTRPEIRIAYAGTILMPREFQLFIEAIRQMRPTLAKPAIIELFGAHSYKHESWFEPAWMREHGNLDEEALQTALRSCTWGFAPMSLSDADPRYNRFSFPTKFISYLMAGLPVITLGHPESSVMKMAEKYRVGVATSAGDINRLVEALREPLADANPWSRHADEINRCARAEFDAAKMRKVLYECLTKCAEATRQRPDRIRS
jgi:hypothetical protein